MLKPETQFEAMRQESAQSVFNESHEVAANLCTELKQRLGRLAVQGANLSLEVVDQLTRSAKFLKNGGLDYRIDLARRYLHDRDHESDAFRAAMLRRNPLEDPLTGSEYGVYTFNSERADPQKNTLVLLHGFTSSPLTTQGRATAWYLSEYFPDQLVITIANEGTAATQVSTEWFQSASLEKMATIRMALIERVRKDHDIDVTASQIDLIGQSMGSVLAHIIEKTYTGNVTPAAGSSIGSIVHMAMPDKGGLLPSYSANFLYGELRHIIKEERTKHLVGVTQHSIEAMPKRSLDALALFRQVRLLADFQPDFRDFPTDNSFIFGEKDPVCRQQFQELAREKNPHNFKNVMMVKNKSHNLLLNAGLCASLIYVALNNRNGYLEVEREIARTTTAA